MPRVVHFEIAANNPEQMKAFYEDVFGWQFQKYPGPTDYWLITTGDAASPGINGGMFIPTETFNGTVNTVEVPDLDAYVARVQANGGTVAVEKTAIPGVGYQVYCKDAEGTIFGLHQADPKAGM